MAVLTNFNYNPNLGGVNGFGSEFSNTCYYAKVAATTDTTLTVPSMAGVGAIANINSKILAIFGYQSGATVFVANNQAATVATSASFATSPGSINPTCKVVKAGDVLHFYALAEGFVSVEFQAWQ